MRIQAAPLTPRYVRPVDAQWPVTAAYKKPGNWQAGYHTGIDFGTPVGTLVHAIAEGDVRDRSSLYGPAYGLTIVINTDDGPYPASGSDIAYCHLSRRVVSTGQRVTAGQLIGYTGNTGNTTGPHIHVKRRPRQGGYGTDLNPVLWDDSAPV